MTSTTQVKVETSHSKLKSHITKQLLTSILVDMRIYLPLKVIFTSPSGLGELSLFRVDKSICLPH